ncbi:type II TA system antitoxin MqsA family protein [Enterococcus sp.]|uniref:type II TA system antitoxin MqsA family protein n=1 Tax=Enterococcus sp. TaxID=35783 RepID=UPI00290DDD1E|nr:type II TA system antitoxin MqsA family protein [Enterococcus sp.]MDU5333905.1 helix-turn-helix domain-containing protein [Enterococcus sp.]
MERMCYECGDDEFKEIHVSKNVKVKELEFEVEHRYFECTSCGERYCDFDHPNENLVRNYNKYRKLKKWLIPEEVRNIRGKYKLSQKEYASLLGISYSTLSAIENGSLQNKAHESQFVLSQSAMGMKQLVAHNQELFSSQKLSELLSLLDTLIVDEYQEVVKKSVI